MLAALAPLPARMVTQSMRFDALVAQQNADAQAYAGLTGLGTDLSIDAVTQNGGWPLECDPDFSEASGECVPWSYSGRTPPQPFVVSAQGTTLVQTTAKPATAAATPRDTSKDLIKGIPNTTLGIAAAGLVALVVIARM